MWLGRTGGADSELQPGAWALPAQASILEPAWRVRASPLGAQQLPSPNPPYAIVPPGPSRFHHWGGASALRVGRDGRHLAVLSVL